jgi:hypothetical protein
MSLPTANEVKQMSLSDAIDLRERMLELDQTKNFHPSSGGELAARLSWANQRIHELTGEWP